MIEKLEIEDYPILIIKLIKVDEEYISDMEISLSANDELDILELMAFSEALKDQKFRLDRVIEQLLS